MGRTKVRKYLKATDAQAVWKEYSEYMTTASKGASEKRKLTQYVTNTVLDSKFRGTSQQFVLHFNELFRRLDESTDLAEKMHESIKMALLQNAVKDFPQLSIVETLDEYTSTISGAGSSTQLTYTSCSSMLVLDMMQPILPPLPRGGMYIQLLELKISMLLKTPQRTLLS